MQQDPGRCINATNTSTDLTLRQSMGRGWSAHGERTHGGFRPAHRVRSPERTQRGALPKEVASTCNRPQPVLGIARRRGRKCTVGTKGGGASQVEVRHRGKDRLWGQFFSTAGRFGGRSSRRCRGGSR